MDKQLMTSKNVHVYKHVRLKYDHLIICGRHKAYICRKCSIRDKTPAFNGCPVIVTGFKLPKVLDCTSNGQTIIDLKERPCLYWYWTSSIRSHYIYRKCKRDEMLMSNRCSVIDPEFKLLNVLNWTSNSHIINNHYV